MNYKMKVDNGVHQVLETSTEQIIKTFDNKDSCRKFMRRLNLGSGFDGFTPSFFLKKIEIKKNKNKRKTK